MNESNLLKDEADTQCMRSFRQSNFELLRIFAMLMIILFHIWQHGPLEQITNTDSIAKMGNGYFSYPHFYKRLLIFDAIRPLGMIGNGLFMMISGYFMIQKSHIDLLKVSKKLLLQLGFATVFLVVVSALYAHFGPDAEGLSLVTFTAFNNSWWFIGYYFIVIVIAALFLNRFLAGLKRGKYLTFLLVLFALVQFGWTGEIAESLATNLRTAMIGVFLYAFGGYLYTYNPLRNIRTYVFFAVIALTYLITFISGYNNTVTQIGSYWLRGGEGVYIQSFIERNNYEIDVMIFGPCLFELFRRMPVFHNKVINFLGSSTLMIYLIHENDFFRSFYIHNDWISVIYESPFQFILKLLAWMLIGFVAGSIVYCLYLAGGKALKGSKRLFIQSDEATAKESLQERNANDEDDEEYM